MKKFLKNSIVIKVWNVRNESRIFLLAPTEKRTACVLLSKVLFSAVMYLFSVSPVIIAGSYPRDQCLCKQNRWR